MFLVESSVDEKDGLAENSPEVMLPLPKVNVDVFKGSLFVAEVEDGVLNPKEKVPLFGSD